MLNISLAVCPTLPLFTMPGHAHGNLWLHESQIVIIAIPIVLNESSFFLYTRDVLFYSNANETMLNVHNKCRTRCELSLLPIVR